MQDDPNTSLTHSDWKKAYAEQIDARVQRYKKLYLRRLSHLDALERTDDVFEAEQPNIDDLKLSVITELLPDTDFEMISAQAIVEVGLEALSKEKIKVETALLISRYVYKALGYLRDAKYNMDLGNFLLGRFQSQLAIEQIHLVLSQLAKLKLSCRIWFDLRTIALSFGANLEDLQKEEAADNLDIFYDKDDDDDDDDDDPLEDWKLGV